MLLVTSVTDHSYQPLFVIKVTLITTTVIQNVYKSVTEVKNLLTPLAKCYRHLCLIGKVTYNSIYLYNRKLIKFSNGFFNYLALMRQMQLFVFSTKDVNKGLFVYTLNLFVKIIILRPVQKQISLYKGVLNNQQNYLYK